MNTVNISCCVSGRNNPVVTASETSSREEKNSESDHQVTHICIYFESQFCKGSSSSKTMMQCHVRQETKADEKTTKTDKEALGRKKQIAILLYVNSNSKLLARTLFVDAQERQITNCLIQDFQEKRLHFLQYNDLSWTLKIHFHQHLNDMKSLLRFSYLLYVS